MNVALNYAELVLQAEKAVAGVKDPDLKQIAFKKILDSLFDAKSVEPKKVLGQRKKPNPATSRKASSKGGPKAYIEELVTDDFFKTPKTINEVKSELENLGHHIVVT